jgi:hypothetical protein
MMNVRTIAIAISVSGICFSGAYSSSDMRMPNIPGPKGPQADPETPALTKMSVIAFGRMGRLRQQPDLDLLHKQFLVSHCLKRGLASSKNQMRSITATARSASVHKLGLNE